VFTTVMASRLLAPGDEVIGVVSLRLDSGLLRNDANLSNLSSIADARVEIFASKMPMF
jgi:hypothetical protein